MTKREIRTQIRRLKAEKLSAASAYSLDELAMHPRVKAANTILLYHALPDEVNTTVLLTALADKRLLLPVVVGVDLELRIYTGTTRTGAFGIEEPVGEVFTQYGEVQAVIVPGVAFTADGRRLGRGRGYYDRLLPRLTHAFRIGLCFDFQLVDDLPSEPHDITMHEVWTVQTK